MSFKRDDNFEEIFKDKDNPIEIMEHLCSIWKLKLAYKAKINVLEKLENMLKSQCLGEKFYFYTFEAEAMEKILEKCNLGTMIKLAEPKKDEAELYLVKLL